MTEEKLLPQALHSTHFGPPGDHRLGFSGNLFPYRLAGQLEAVGRPIRCTSVPSLTRSGILTSARGPSPPSPGGRNLPGEHRLFRSVPLVVHDRHDHQRRAFIRDHLMMIPLGLGAFPPGWLHLQPKFLPPWAWFRTLNTGLNHHPLAVPGSVFSSNRLDAVHLVHVAIPRPRGQPRRLEHFLTCFLTRRSAPLLSRHWGVLCRNLPTTLNQSRKLS